MTIIRKTTTNSDEDMVKYEVLCTVVGKVFSLKYLNIKLSYSTLSTTQEYANSILQE